MAINPDDFIFHSDLTPHQVVVENTINVATGGSLGGFGRAVWASPWTNAGLSLPEVDFMVYYPGTVYYPNTTGSWFMGPVTLVIDNTYNLDVSCTVELSGSNYRCIVEAVNPYDFAVGYPSYTYTFKIRGYLPPAL